MKILGLIYGESMNSTRTYELAEFNMFVTVILRADTDGYLKYDSRYHQAGLYYLIGPQPYHSRRKIYIGETADIDKRLRQHLEGKEFWECAVIFIRFENEQLNKSQVKYLEHVAIKEAIECGSVELLENCQIPKEVYLTDKDKDEMNNFFRIVKLMIQYAGFDIYTDYKICEVDTTDNSHTMINRMIKHYHKGTVKKYTLDENESSGMVCEDICQADDNDDEDDNVTYEIKPYNKECYATAIILKDKTVMIMPYGYISKKVEFSKISDIVDIDSCIDRNSRYIKKDIIVKNLDDAALVICGERDRRCWRKIKHEIEEYE